MAVILTASTIGAMRILEISTEQAKGNVTIPIRPTSTSFSSRTVMALTSYTRIYVHKFSKPFNERHVPLAYIERAEQRQL